jgi:protein-S-isoprenylcysteine O-methyltransferase Ste14
LLEYIAIVLGVALFGIQHSGFSSLRVKNKVIDKWGKGGYANLFKSTSIITFGMAFLSMNYWNWLYFILAPQSIDLPLLLFGGIFLIVGLYVSFKASSVISVSTVADMRTDRTPELVTDGIYSRIRHPLYLATILLFVALSLIYFDPRVIVFATGMSVYTIIGAHFEEQKLISHYGDEYRGYKEKAGFILPKS